MDPVEIAIVEDNQEILASLQRIIERAPGLHCVCTCTTGAAALQTIPRHRPQVVIMDLQLPDISGIECTARLRDLAPDSQVLVYTVYADSERVFHALEAGAFDFSPRRRPDSIKNSHDLNGWYTENYDSVVKSAVNLGSVYGCASDGRISAAARVDYAEAAAVVLAADGHAGKTYELAGDTAFSLAELASEIGRQAGKSIGYVNLSEPEYKKVLLGVGLPEPYAALLADSDTGISKGALYDESRQLSRLIGRNTTPISVAVKSAL